MSPICLELGSANPPPAPFGNSEALRQALRQRHGGKWNMVFCDGHVESLTTGQLFDYHQDEILQRWNRDHLPHRESVPDWLKKRITAWPSLTQASTSRQ